MEKIQELLKNKTILYSIIGVVVLVLIIIIGSVIFVATKPKDNSQTYEKVIKDKPFELFTTTNPGQAIEVQALLARNNIEATRSSEGSKTTLKLEKYYLIK